MKIPRPAIVTLFLTVAVLLVAWVAYRKAHPEPILVDTSQNLRLVAAYRLDVREPSGLSLAPDKRSLWTVSDKDGSVYQISLEGKTLHHFDTGRGDLEAVTTMDANHLAFIAERERMIVITRNDGTVVNSAPVAISGPSNKGPEALTYDEHGEVFYVVQEHPGILLTLDRQLREIDRRELKFAQDYSSISFDSIRKEYWVLSDRSRSIHVLNEALQIQESFSADVKQMEGIAVDHEKRLVYVTSDPEAMLYVFEFDAW